MFISLQAKFHGTPVTREAFLQWRECFEKELKEAVKQTKVSSSLGSKLTGYLLARWKCYSSYNMFVLLFQAVRCLKKMHLWPSLTQDSSQKVINLLFVQYIPLTPSLIFISIASADEEVEHKDVEVDESLFQDLDDLDIDEQS